jgi:hypothetical protein
MDSDVKASETQRWPESGTSFYQGGSPKPHPPINVRNLARSIRFHRETFGLVETFRA